MAMISKKKWKNELKKKLIDFGFTNFSAGMFSRGLNLIDVYPYLTPTEMVDFIIEVHPKYGMPDEFLLAAR